jgi:TPR repeat protein
MSKRSERAEKKYRQDADRGDPVAQFYLGHAYSLDAEETQDYTEALIWIRKAAAQDYELALAHLGYLYHSGCGVSVDLAESKSWFRKAAEQGDSHHEYTYATMCWNGDFGARDAKEAEVWWLKAAEQGMPEAHMALGGFYGDFWGTRPILDCMKSYMWHTLAALQDKPGHLPEAARTARDRIAQDMSPEQVAEAEDRVQLWLEEHSEVMGKDLVSHWRERVADPLEPRTPEEAAEAMAEIEASLKSIEKKFKRFDRDS